MSRDRIQVTSATSEIGPVREISYIGPRGERLDSFVVHILTQLSRTRVQAMIEHGLVQVNKQRAKAGLKLSQGDRVTLEEPVLRIPQPSPEADAPTLDTLFEDDQILIINKPAGLVVHPAPGHAQGTLVDALLAQSISLPAAPDDTGPQRPGIVHRLDKDTSGLLIVAKTPGALAHLAQQFQTHTIIKCYLALVEGHLPAAEGAIDAPIGRHRQHRQRMTITAQHGRQAHTLFWVERSFSRFSLLRLQIITGRTHQIRVHLAAIGHPVAGDPIYGHNQQPEPPRLFLHAAELHFTHPLTNQEMAFTAPLPPELERFLATLH